MEVAEGVLHRNAFSFLDSDDEAPAPKAKAKAQPAPKKVTESKPQSRDARGDRGDRGDRGGRGRDGSSRGRGRGGRGRGRGGERSDGKREFERHQPGNGHGRGERAKKDGHGKFNWGTEGEQVEASSERPARRFNGNRDGERPPRRNNRADEEAKPADEAAEKPADEVAEKPAAEDPEPVEPEPEVMDYDEFLVQKAANQPEEDKNKKLRTVENDESQWKVSSLKEAAPADVEDEYQVGEQENKPKRNKKGKNKKTAVSLDEFAKAPAQSSGGRGRGRGRGRGGRGNGGRGQNFKLQADEFPTLGGKK